MVAFTDGFSRFVLGGLVIASVLTAAVIAVIANRAAVRIARLGAPLVWIGKRSWPACTFGTIIPSCSRGPRNATGRSIRFPAPAKCCHLRRINFRTSSSRPHSKRAIGKFVKGVRSGEINTYMPSPRQSCAYRRMRHRRRCRNRGIPPSFRPLRRWGHRRDEGTRAEPRL